MFAALDTPSLSTSQFGDIYQEDYFMNYLKNDVRIVKEFPSHLQSLDLEAIGSQVGDSQPCPGISQLNPGNISLSDTLCFNCTLAFVSGH
jgi:hypothetical protein